MLKYFAAALFSLILISPAFSQMADVEFGKNRLQFKNFNWRYYSTENFEIYFYDGGNEIARTGAKYLEKEFDRITDILGYSSYYKTKIFIYNSVLDLQQSNVGIHEASYEIGGQTDFVRSQVEVAFPGTMEQFKVSLTYAVAEMLINDMMYGGSLSDMFQSSYLLSLPEWFVSGAAAYVAEGWSVEMDNYVREMMRNDRLNKIASFEGDDARLIGHSIWNFIAERYGQSYISNILNLTRIVRNEEKSIAGTIGVSYKRFIDEWNQYYSEQASFVDNNYILPPKESIIEEIKKSGVDLNKIRISPDGNYLAYSKNVRGRYKVIVRNLNNGKEKTILRSGYKVLNQEVDKDMPLLSWQSENVLGIVYAKYGRNWLSLHTLGSGASVKKELSRINQIKGFDIAINSNLAVVSAERNGSNDLYLISLKRNSIKRITNDLFDDIDPRFIPESGSIVFSSNRTTDSIMVNDKTISDITNIYNVFIYNIDTTRNTVYRVTNTLSKNISPVAPNKSDIYFLSDQQGIFNIFKYDLSKNLFFQVSNFASNLEEFDVSVDKSILAFQSFNRGTENIHLIKDYDLDKNIFTQQTKRQQYLNAKRVAKKLIEKRKQQALEDAEKAEEAEDQEAASSILDEYQLDTTQYVNTDDYKFDQTKPDAEPEKAEPDTTATEYVDTDNYVFDTDVVKSDGSTGSFLSKYRKLKKEKDLVGPLDYKTRFTADNVVTSFGIDPLMGFGFNFKAQMNDLLENHSFKAGIFAATDFRNSDFYGEYNYLKNLIDFKLRFERSNLYREYSTISTQKYNMNKIIPTVSLPFNVATRVSLSPFYAFTQYYELDPSGYIFHQGNNPISATDHYMGLKAEVVFDNSETTGLNEIKGTRGKLGMVHWEGINDAQNSFNNVYLDIRNYQQLHREIVFATRLFYGRYWGPDPKTYLLGGMDNWIANKTRRENPNNTERPTDDFGFESLKNNSDVLFMDFITGLRGFDYNSFNGTNAVLFNAELRFPIVKYFYRGPISSNFFRNLQFIGFYDIGSAWTGNSPLATVNSINTEIIKPNGSPFQATIQNFRNPFLQSYGVGMRTVLLGYYMKFDWAYPIEDGIRKDPRLFVTFGFDF